MKRAVEIIVLGSLLYLASSPRTDAGVLGSAQANADGTYTYSYSIDNTGGTFDVFAWTLEFDLTPGQIDWNQLDQQAGGDVVVPNDYWIAGQGIPAIGGLSAQDFLSLDPAADVVIGGSLSGFSFTSAFAPVQAVYTIEFGPLGDSLTGTTIGPGAPIGVGDSGASWLLFALGVVSVGARRVARRGVSAG